MENREKLIALLQVAQGQEGPYISIYLPTHRRMPDNMQDPILYKNLLQEAEKQLSEGYPRREWESAVQALQQLLEEQDFWNHTGDGLGVLAVGRHRETFLLNHQPQAEALVDRQVFQVLPLARHSQIQDRLILADLGRDRLSLYLADAKGLEPMGDSGIKLTIGELFDDFDANANLRTGSYGGLSGSFHGHGGGTEEEDRDRDKYFLYLDGALRELSKGMGLPVLLAGNAATVGAFKRLAKEGTYLERSLDKALSAMSEQQVQDGVGEALGALSRETEERTSTRVRRAQQKNLTMNLGADLLPAAREGRIEEIFLNPERLDHRDKKLNQAVLEALRTGAAVSPIREVPQGLPPAGFALMRY